MNQVVFISRDPEDSESLISLLHDDGFDVISRSMIKTEMVSFPKEFPMTDWIFFSSVNAVKYFFQQAPKWSTQLFGCIGDKTASELSKYVTPTFVGRSMDPMITAQSFAELVGHQSVLFAGAEDSLRSIQSALPPSSVHDLICYKTRPHPCVIEHANVLVFSSPSNVRSFFQLNHIGANQKCIAFGPSTKKALDALGVRNSMIPQSLSDDGIFHAIKQSMTS